MFRTLEQIIIIKTFGKLEKVWCKTMDHFAHGAAPAVRPPIWEAMCPRHDCGAANDRVPLVGHGAAIEALEPCRGPMDLDEPSAIRSLANTITTITITTTTTTTTTTAIQQRRQRQ